MKKARIVIAAVITGMLLSGCGIGGNATSVFSPSESRIFVARDGTVSSALVENYENDNYSQEELKASIEEAVNAYNTEHGGTRVTLTSCTLGNGTAAALFDYAGGEDLCAFAKETDDTANQAESLVVTTISDGLVSGRVSDGVWIKAQNGSSVSADTVMKQGELHLVDVKGAVTVQTEGKIQFYSGQITLQDDFTAVSAGGEAYIVFK